LELDREKITRAVNFFPDTRLEDSSLIRVVMDQASRLRRVDFIANGETLALAGTNHPCKKPKGC
jgi:hypothetical protein